MGACVQKPCPPLAPWLLGRVGLSACGGGGRVEGREVGVGAAVMTVGVTVGLGWALALGEGVGMMRVMSALVG